jgi:hypothetical protein
VPPSGARLCCVLTGVCMRPVSKLGESKLFHCQYYKTAGGAMLLQFGWVPGIRALLLLLEALLPGGPPAGWTTSKFMAAHWTHLLSRTARRCQTLLCWNWWRETRTPASRQPCRRCSARRPAAAWWISSCRGHQSPLAVTAAGCSHSRPV